MIDNNTYWSITPEISRERFLMRVKAVLKGIEDKGCVASVTFRESGLYADFTAIYYPNGGMCGGGISDEFTSIGSQKYRHGSDKEMKNRCVVYGMSIGRWAIDDGMDRLAKAALWEYSAQPNSR
jgi:hypothetical protein